MRGAGGGVSKRQQKKEKKRAQWCARDDREIL
jgi:hypothetical protein